MFLASIPARAAEPALSIVQSGVQQSEDAPFAPKSYQFLPGEDLYFTFQVAGFTVKSDSPEQPRRISLSYETVPLDANNLPLATPDAGKIQEELNPEDKNWLPRRSSVFHIPSFLAAGEFFVRLTVKDELAGAEVTRKFPFQIGGTKLQPSSAITVQNFRFLRTADSREPLDIPAFRAADIVYVRFEITGFKVDLHNGYHVSYGVTVFSPDGKTYLDNKHAAELESASFYPAQYIPGVISVSTGSDSSPGAYALVLEVHDLLANQSYQLKQVFRIE